MPTLKKLTSALAAVAMSTTMLTPVAIAKPQERDARNFKTERPRAEIVRREDPRFSSRSDRGARPDRGDRVRGDRANRGGGDRVRGDRGDRGDRGFRGDRGGGDQARGNRNQGYAGVRGNGGQGYTGTRGNRGSGYTGIRPEERTELRGGPNRDQRRHYGDHDQRRHYGDRDRHRDYDRDRRHRDYARHDRNYRHGGYRDRGHYRDHRRHVRYNRDWYRRDFRHKRHHHYRHRAYHHPRGWRYYRYTRPINIFSANVYYGPYYRTSYLPRYYIGGVYHYHPRTVIMYDYHLYGLYEPPYGYHWVYDYGSGDAVLASIATGAIIGLVIGALAGS